MYTCYINHPLCLISRELSSFILFYTVLAFYPALDINIHHVLDSINRRPGISKSQILLVITGSTSKLLLLYATYRYILNMYLVCSLFYFEFALL